MRRRNFVASLALSSTSLAYLAAANVKSRSIGICSFSCNLQWQASRRNERQASFYDAMGFYDYARGLGAQAVQTSFRELDQQRVNALRTRSQSEGVTLEGDLRLPKSGSEVDAFEREVELTCSVGAKVARATLMGGRRYEVFQSLQEFRNFHMEAKKRLQIVEPILARHRLKLAIENHKDLIIDEQVTLLKELSSEWVGALVDTGNNIALLEAPQQVVASLAPYAMSVHLKDMAVQPDRDGFLLSEVPLGTGFLDLGTMIEALQKANPEIIFNLEMATRDPLLIPCLTEGYWSTFPERRSQHLQTALDLVQRHPPRQPPPTIKGKPLDQQLADEEANNRSSLSWMNKHFS